MKDKFDRIENEELEHSIILQLKNKKRKMKHNLLNMCITKYHTQLTPRVSTKGGGKSNKWK